MIHPERRRLFEEANKLETFEERKAWWLANRDKIIATFPRVPKASYLDWDYEPSGYEGETNGEFNA